MTTTPKKNDGHDKQQQDQQARRESSQGTTVFHPAEQKLKYRRKYDRQNRGPDQAGQEGAKDQIEKVSEPRKAGEQEEIRRPLFC